MREKIQNSNCYKTQKIKCNKTKNLNCNKTKKNWIGRKFKSMLDKFQKFKLSQNSMTQIVTKPYNLNFDNSYQLILWQNSKTQFLIKWKISDKSLFLRTTWHLNNWWDVFKAAICNLAKFFIKGYIDGLNPKFNFLSMFSLSQKFYLIEPKLENYLHSRQKTHLIVPKK